MVATVTYRAEIVCGVPDCPWVIRVEAHTPSDGEAALRHAIEAHEQTHIERSVSR